MTLAPEGPDLVPDDGTSQTTSQDESYSTREHVRRLKLLHEAALAFSGTLELEQVLRQILAKTQKLLNAVGWAIWLVDPTTGDLICADVAGPDAESVRGYRMPAGRGIVSTVVESGRSVYIRDLIADHRSVQELTHDLQVPVRSLLCAPLPTDSNIVGALVLVHRSADAYSGADQALLDALAASAAIAIKNARLYERTQTENEEHSRTALALQQSESHYRTLVETSPDAIIVTDLEGKMTLCNHRTLKLCGFDLRSEILGRSIFTLFAAAAIPEVLARYRKAMRGVPLSHVETKLKRQDGTEIDVEWNASLIADGHGEPAGMVTFLRDITDRKRAAAALRRRNQDLHVLNTVATELSKSHDPKHLLTTALDQTLSAVSAAIGWVSLSAWDQPDPAPEDAIEIYRGRLVEPDVKAKSCMSAAMTQMSSAVRASRTLELAHTPWLCDALDLPGMDCHLAATPIAIQDNVIGELGIAKPVQVTAANNSTVFDDHDRALLSAVGRQISVAVESARLRQAIGEAEVLRKLNRLRAELIANLSHDLRTPLGIIDMAASTLKREGRDLDLTPEMREDVLLDIEGQVKRLNVLIEDILDVGRLESSHLTMEIQTLDLGLIISVVVASMQRMRPQHNFVMELPDDPVIITADRSRIEQVLYNLVDNAVKYSPKGGDIVIKVTQTASVIGVRVSDQGIGIPSEALDAIFERFYRVESAATQHIDGEGLGLATAKSIIESHGGTIWAESELGGGSTFVFTLPLPETHQPDTR